MNLYKNSLDRGGVSSPQPDTLGKPWALAAHGGGLLCGQAGQD